MAETSEPFPRSTSRPRCRAVGDRQKLASGSVYESSAAPVAPCWTVRGSVSSTKWMKQSDSCCGQK